MLNALFSFAQYTGAASTAGEKDKEARARFASPMNVFRPGVRFKGLNKPHRRSTATKTDNGRRKHGKKKHRSTPYDDLGDLFSSGVFAKRSNSSSSAQGVGTHTRTQNQKPSSHTTNEERRSSSSLGSSVESSTLYSYYYST